MSDISREDIDRLASLARLAMTDEELDTFADQLDQIMEAMSKVAQVDTSGVEPMSHPHAIKAPMREDVFVETLTQEQALDQAPEVEDDRFVVPQILGETE
ncbi:MULTISPECIES: Asp-tRNA(Asn)/Glu-tRNA(Gln) amidotransferase subunit GatC [Corynebacterium]|uniref:Aspartyl/glutamyl-tRNA(Asn/Gln) amidotransferase subunit C n=1 Tax=Corynebacterium pilosum TaxID=35756 RepID=A0A376CQ99_9CORY|nr:Asp-tRNA(Asn)/Glu-tRNA(Gln) amidotransferase subunit GatC [Corynebacterium pilosum]STC70259.1 aspartyl/glutamyl-tRNA amidotransferase subunit C [Corynebacterium pilosum]